MGQKPKGVETIWSSDRINIQTLRREGIFKKGTTIQATISWRENSMSIVSSWIGEEPSLRLIYQVNSTWMREPKKYDYQIKIARTPSNLGQGELLYFICPETGRRCRTIYRAYGSHIFKHREAYRERIYYPLQLEEHLYRETAKYFNYERKIEKLQEMREASSYDGKPTRRSLRMDRLQAKLWEADIRRWDISNWPATLRKIMINSKDLG